MRQELGSHLYILHQSISSKGIDVHHPENRQIFKIIFRWKVLRLFSVPTAWKHYYSGFFNIHFSKLEGSKHINDISVMTKAWKKGHLKSFKWNFYLHDKNFRLRHFWAHRVHFITSGETWDIKIRILMMTYVTFLVQLYL